MAYLDDDICRNRVMVLCRWILLLCMITIYVKTARKKSELKIKDFQYQKRFMDETMLSLRKDEI